MTATKTINLSQEEIQAISNIIWFAWGHIGTDDEPLINDLGTKFEDLAKNPAQETTEKTLILKIYEDGEDSIKLDVDANTSTKVVHASVINLLPSLIKQFAEGLAGDDKEFYKSMIAQATKELTGGVAQVHQVDVKVTEMKPVAEIFEFAMQVASKFIAKVESGKAKSVETYKDMQELVAKIQKLTQAQPENKEEPAPQS